MDKEKSNSNKNKDIETHRRLNRDKIAGLHAFLNDYSIDKFMQDLNNYFDNEVDFNLDKINDMLKDSGQLEKLITRAKQMNSHPVIELVQDIFKDLPDRL